MSGKPTFGRYAEIPYEEMTPEQQEAYRSLIETRGPLGGRRKIWVHNPKLDHPRRVRSDRRHARPRPGDAGPQLIRMGSLQRTLRDPARSSCRLRL